MALPSTQGLLCSLLRPQDFRTQPVIERALKKCLLNKKPNAFLKKKKLFFFNSKIIYIVENLENTEYQVQKIQLRTFINTFDHQSLSLTWLSHHVPRVQVGLSLVCRCVGAHA